MPSADGDPVAAAADPLPVASSPLHARHDPTTELCAGTSIPCWERASRAELIAEALAGDARFTFVPVAEHGRSPIEAVHDPRLVAYLERAWERLVEAGVTLGPAGAQVHPDTYVHPALRDGMGPGARPRDPLAELALWCFDTATALTPGTYAAARSAVDVALTAADLVLTGAPAAYGLCRPPGHHAPRAAYGGYCYFNNAAIAAQHLLDAGAARIAVLDVDYHHGNGTQQIFYARADVAYVSIHGDPDRAYPYVTGYADETGTGPGLGCTANFPLEAGAGDRRFASALAGALDEVTRHRPDVLVVSLGVDGHAADPLGDFELTTEAFASAGRTVRELGLPTVVVQEGGYALDELAANVRAFLVPFATPPR